MSKIFVYNLRPYYCHKILLFSKRHKHCVRMKYLNTDLSMKKHSAFAVSNRKFSWGGLIAAVGNSTPVIKTEEFLLEFHSTSCLPWWVEIFIVTLGIRSILVLPLAVHQNQVIAKLMNVNTKLGEMAPELNKEVNIAKKLYNLDTTIARKVFKRQMRVHYQRAVIEDNCHPFKIVLLGMIQIPVWICFSFALRNLTYASLSPSSGTDDLFMQLNTEGILWFTDLTVPDPFVMPVLLILVNLTVIELNALRKVGKGSLLQKVLYNSMRLVTLVVGAAATINPSCMTFYWLCSSSLGLGQNVLFMFPSVRRILKIPHTKLESSTPFKDVANNFRTRFIK